MRDNVKKNYNIPVKQLGCKDKLETRPVNRDQTVSYNNLYQLSVGVILLEVKCIRSKLNKAMWTKVIDWLKPSPCDPISLSQHVKYFVYLTYIHP